VGDFVLVSPDEKDLPCEIGRIRRLFDAGDGDDRHMFECEWVWRPEQLDLTDAEKETFAPGEVFINTECDDNSLDAIEMCAAVPCTAAAAAIAAQHKPTARRPCKVVHTTEPVGCGPQMFFCRQAYDTEAQEFSALTSSGTAAAGPSGRSAAQQPARPPAPVFPAAAAPPLHGQRQCLLQPRAPSGAPR
jgi:hypothetical protein